jgi:hypothetical protein
MISKSYFKYKRKINPGAGLFSFSMVLITILLLLTGCALKSESGSEIDTQPAEESVQVTEEKPEEPGTEEENLKAIEKLIDQLGQKLKNVSLSSPPDILKDHLEENYKGLISGELIQKWADNPSQGLGRQTSSPWPDRIEIDQIKKVGPGHYLLTGQVIEVTSVEVSQGGYSGKYPVDLTVTLQEGQWLVTGFNRGPYESKEPDKDLRSMFDNLDKTTDNIGGIFEFIDQNIEYASPELATDMVYTVIGLCEGYKGDMLTKFSPNHIQEAIFEALPSLDNIDMELLKTTKDEDLRTLIEEAIAKKYRLIALEGSFEPVIDYQAYQQYSPYITHEMDSYIALKAKESNSPALLEAGIAVSMDEYVQRIIEAMDFVNEYPDSPRASEIKGYANLRLRFYLGGIDNSPAFDFNGKVLPERLQDFEEKLEIYRDTEFSGILDSYLKLLQQQDYVKTQQVIEFLDQIGSRWGP